MKKHLSFLAILTGMLLSTTFANNPANFPYPCDTTHQAQAGHENHNYCPADKSQLVEVIKALQPTRTWEGDYNDIDTSAITDMAGLFSNKKGKKFDL